VTVEVEMRVTASLVFAVAVVVMDGSAARAQAPAPAPPPGSAEAAALAKAEAGKKLWVSYGCWQCHGYEAQGGAAGPRLAARNLPWAGFSAYVRRPGNQMPPYTEKVVSNAELTNIYAFVQSRPVPPAVAAVPLLRK
jgi:ubiquinol-cytochrome c reductase cytochrome c subunit